MALPVWMCLKYLSVKCLLCTNDAGVTARCLFREGSAKGCGGQIKTKIMCYADITLDEYLEKREKGQHNKKSR